MGGRYTPGPWRVSTLGALNDGAVPVSGPDYQVARITCQAEFKRGNGHAAECVERDANARLIAAAPDLLAALEELRGGELWTQRAEDAIAKARGADE